MSVSQDGVRKSHCLFLASPDLTLTQSCSLLPTWDWPLSHTPEISHPHSVPGLRVRRRHWELGSGNEESFCCSRRWFLFGVSRALPGSNLQQRSRTIPSKDKSLSWPSPVALSGGLWGNQSRAHGWPSSCTAVLGHYGFQIITVSPSTDPWL
jgi:hypothetical protein